MLKHFKSWTLKSCVAFSMISQFLHLSNLSFRKICFTSQGRLIAPMLWFLRVSFVLMKKPPLLQYVAFIQAGKLLGSTAEFYWEWKLQEAFLSQLSCLPLQLLKCKINIYMNITICEYVHPHFYKLRKKKGRRRLGWYIRHR